MEPPTIAEREAIVKFYLGDKAWNSSDSFSAFLVFYRRTTNSQTFRFATCQVDEPIITSHPQLQQLVQQLRNNPGFTRKQFENAIFPKDGISGEELRHAIKVIVKLGFMLDCTRKELPAKSVYNFQRSIPGWESDKSFTDFVASGFPKLKLDEENEPDHLPAIYAWKLKQRCKVNFERTDDISEHLLYDRNSRTLKVFHQMSYLRIQLQRHTYPIEDLSLEESLRRGTLPPQLILETLESFYELLFPIVADRQGRSRRLLKRLIKKNGFDPQVLTGSHARWIPEDFRYIYWGDRLKELGELLKRPPPTTNWMSWLEERTSERNALMIAIVGLFLSAFFGLISCIIGAAQLWIAVLAWKNPES